MIWILVASWMESSVGPPYWVMHDLRSIVKEINNPENKNDREAAPTTMRHETRQTASAVAVSGTDLGILWNLLGLGGSLTLTRVAVGLEDYCRTLCSR